MSRASDLRDGLITELKILLPGERIEPFWTPNFPLDWLSDGPIIAVRAAGRTLSSMQGPDVRTIGIEVGVFGMAVASDEASTDPIENLRAQVESGDIYDQLVEDLIALWTPAGPLDGTDGEGIAEHAFREIEQTSIFDAPLLYESGLWAGVFLVTYEDSRDD